MPMGPTRLIRASMLALFTVLSPALFAAADPLMHHPALAAEPLLIQADTRAQREEIERQIDQAPAQRGLSKPTDLYPMSFTPEEMPARLATRRDFLWDVGGWGRATFTTFDTVVDTDRTLRDYDVRVWGRANYTDYQSIYGRVRSFYTDYNTTDAPDGKDENWQALRVDQLFYEGRMARTFGMRPEADLDVTVGRQFFFLGKGLALSNVLDGARVDGRWYQSGFTLLGAQTIHYSPDFDPTVPETKSESDRMFIGFNAWTAEYLGRRFSMYGLAQIDRNNYRSPGQGYAYRSYYVGVGGDGDIPIPGLSFSEVGYSGEIVYQFGRSTASGTTEREDIQAFGFLGDVFWLPPRSTIPWRSKAVFSYYFGSGDPDRGAPQGTVGGNTAGSNDTALNYFGFVNTGYSLAPRLANLHVMRLNWETAIISDDREASAAVTDYTRELKIGVAYYSFLKHHTGAPMSDFTSVEDGGYVGSEFDVYLDWAVTSDLDVSARYGVFLPGDSFEFSTPRHFFSLGVTLSF